MAQAMELYFFRHGPAGSAQAWSGQDSDRPLTDKGKALTQHVASRLAESGLTVDLVLTSPYVRAVQTAEIAVEALGVSTPLIQDTRLRPGFDMAGLAELLERHAGLHRLMVVGHEPDFSGAIGNLIGSADLELKKSGIAMVELEDPLVLHGVLRWLAPPSLLV